MAKNNESDREKIIARISRIEGQIKGIRKMVEERKSCLDVVVQVTAAREALSMLGIELLKNDFVCRRKGSDYDERFMKTLFKLK